MIDLEKCTPFRKGQHAAFISEENRCTHRGDNPNKSIVRHFRIDGDVFKKGAVADRCDYLLLNDTDHRAYFIELKGSDIPKAIKQIEDTIAAVKRSITEYSVKLRIIYRTGSHKILDAKVTKARTKYGPDLVIKERMYQENI